MLYNFLFCLSLLFSLGITHVAYADNSKEPVIHASFDCAKATGNIDQAICHDEGLRYLDQRLNFYYHTLLTNTSAANKQELINNQLAWLKSRNKACTLQKSSEESESNQATCLIDQYKKQNFILFKKLYSGNEPPLVTIFSPLKFADFNITGPVTKKLLDKLSTATIDVDGQYANGFKAHPNSHPVSNCVEYEKFGIDDDSTYGMAMASFFIDTCGPLRLLQQAQVPKTNPFQTRPINTISLIPVTFLPVLSDDYETQLKELAQKGTTMAQLIHQGKVKVIESSAHSIKFQEIEKGKPVDSVQYQEIAVAKFPKHDVAMLITRTTSARDGGGTLTMFTYGFLTFIDNPPQFNIKEDQMSG